jgi:hypothetical protein
MSVFTKLVAVFLLLGFGCAIAPPDLLRATAQDEPILLVAIRNEVTGIDDGSPCPLFPDAENERMRPGVPQLLINDADGTIIAVIDAKTGFADAETRVCERYTQVPLADSTFYTFSIDGEYRHTVSRDTLQEADWFYHVWLGDQESPAEDAPVPATPETSEATPIS